ncbi:MetQ/NlpA family ABC transporter substrate-binding protein [Gulosibacter chungangensis]|uniref:Methionine ABC transporter substrate-binding protein n=1 Tax=Gulosibacter chungangensis TaxID=979746 RepID=A0A7J5BH67_9MICO|nr:MetQ/NlpA family ABC transporter substrate-binding protein [Gulosibacter chungangensis]KAB1645272.1 methionine ABC transporter substrate-binding protein [Gulosibacter chungangensis]
MARITKALAAAGALALIGSLAACSGGSSDGGETGETIKLGVVGASEPYWAVFEEAVEAEGIDLEIVDFGDYNQPNPALSAGELDINQFQHIIYLAEHNNATGDTLTVIGSTAIYPLGLYSSKYDSVDDIPEGGVVGVPNDTTNQARGLLVLQSAGLISLADGGSPYSTLDDIIADESKVTVQAFNADLIPASLPDLDAGIINNDFVADAGLTAEDAIAQDDPNDPASFGYVNVFAVREEDKTNETLLKLVEIYQTNEDVQAGALEASGGTAVMLVIPAEELQASLAEVQEAQP